MFRNRSPKPPMLLVGVPRPNLAQPSDGLTIAQRLNLTAAARRTSHRPARLVMHLPVAEVRKKLVVQATDDGLADQTKLGQPALTAVPARRESNIASATGNGAKKLLSLAALNGRAPPAAGSLLRGDGQHQALFVGNAHCRNPERLRADGWRSRRRSRRTRMKGCRRPDRIGSAAPETGQKRAADLPPDRAVAAGIRTKNIGLPAVQDLGERAGLKSLRSCDSPGPRRPASNARFFSDSERSDRCCGRSSPRGPR